MVLIEHNIAGSDVECQSEFGACLPQFFCSGTKRFQQSHWHRGVGFRTFGCGHDWNVIGELSPVPESILNKGWDPFPRSLKDTAPKLLQPAPLCLAHGRTVFQENRSIVAWQGWALGRGFIGPTDYEFGLHTDQRKPGIYGLYRPWSLCLSAGLMKPRRGFTPHGQRKKVGVGRNLGIYPPSVIRTIDKKIRIRLS